MSKSPFDLDPHSNSMVGDLCSQCGTYHDSAVCPYQPFDQPGTAVPQPDMVPGKIEFGPPVTLNGVTPGEQAILDKLDKILRAIRNIQ